MKFTIKGTLYILIMVCMLQMMAGCETRQTDDLYQTYITQISSDGSDGTGVTQEKDYWPWDLTSDDKKGQTVSVTFMGKNLTGEYSRSGTSIFTPYIYDHYITDDPILFDVRRDTGEVISIDFRNGNFYDTEPFLEDVANPQETAISMAQKIAAQHISLSDYEQTVEQHTHEKERDGKTYYVTFYTVWFKKYIQGFPTRDLVRVVITSKGNFAAFSKGAIGELDGLTAEIDIEKVNESVIAKVKDKYAKLGFPTSNIEIMSQEVAKTPDGNLGIVSNVGLSFTQGASTYGSAVQLFTNLQNP